MCCVIDCVLVCGGSPSHFHPFVQPTRHCAPEPHCKSAQKGGPPLFNLLIPPSLYLIHAFRASSPHTQRLHKPRALKVLQQGKEVYEKKQEEKKLGKM